jgi:transposase
MISIETWAYIRRLFFHDGMTITAIAEELDLDRKTVRKAVATNDYLTRKQQKHLRLSKLDPFKDAIANIVVKTPKLSGVRMLEKIRDLGYTGGRSILNEYLATLPERKGEVYLRIETEPGGQAQCDWGKCGSVKIGEVTRHLSCFVMVLSWSRFLYVRFYLSETMECFLDGHLRAFRAFGAIPHTILYDNLKSVVRERYGKTILFNPKFMAFAGYHMFKPDPCRPRMPHHKGKVERGVGYTKSNFLAGRQHLLEEPFELAALNHECAKWLRDKNRRIHATTRKQPAELLKAERPHMLPLPHNTYDIAMPQPAHANHQAFVHFDSNLYSVPSEYGGMPLTLKATPNHLDLCKDNQTIASHKRSFDKYQLFEKPHHRQKILRQKQKARQNKEIEFFLALDPVAKTFLKGLVQSGAKISYHIKQIMQMVDIYGKTEVLSAIEHACRYGAYHFEYIENIIGERRRATDNPDQQHPLTPGTTRGQNIRLEEVDMSQYRVDKEQKDQ